jgi:hypothetical protein
MPASNTNKTNVKKTNVKKTNVKKTNVKKTNVKTTNVNKPAPLSNLRGTQSTLNFAAKQTAKVSNEAASDIVDLTMSDHENVVKEVRKRDRTSVSRDVKSTISESGSRQYPQSLSLSWVVLKSTYPHY